MQRCCISLTLQVPCAIPPFVLRALRSRLPLPPAWQKTQAAVKLPLAHAEQVRLIRHAARCHRVGVDLIVNLPAWTRRALSPKRQCSISTVGRRISHKNGSGQCGDQVRANGSGNAIHIYIYMCDKGRQGSQEPGNGQ